MTIRYATSLTLCVMLAYSMARGADRRLELGNADWRINSSRFHITDVEDGRKDRRTAGSVSGPRPATLLFDPTAAEAIENYLRGCIVSDTSLTAPFTLVIDRLRISDAVSGIKHTVTMDFNFKMVREMEGVKTTVFEQSIKPRFTAAGQDAPAGFYENPLKQALQKFLSGFEEWAEQSRKSPLFMNHVQVRFPSVPNASDYPSGDTIPWSHDYRLEWTDFKGKYDGMSPFSAQSNCVYTLRTKPVFENDTMYLDEDIGPCFTRKASWVREDALQDTLLMHEQLHFDLCELYARRFRQKLSD
ncbi:MAG: hypothetical protein ACKO7B_13880, partial [Flavobacteriales bacterium]